MKFTPKHNKIYCPFLLLIVSTAFVLRFKGIWFGFPLATHPDELPIVEAALRMTETGDLNPHFFAYPTLFIYIQAILYKLAQLIGYVFGPPQLEIPEIYYHLISRIFNVFVSVLTIVVTFAIGQQLFSTFAGILAAFFLSFSFLHITNSYFATVDSSVALWASLATLMSVLIYRYGSKKIFYVLGGIFVGLAIGSKYTAFISIVPLLVAHCLRCRHPKYWIDRNLFFCVALVPVVFLATTPFAVLDFGEFWGDVNFVRTVYSEGKIGYPQSETSTTYRIYLDYLIKEGYGVAPTMFAGLGFVLIMLRSPWKTIILTAFPLIYFALLGSYKVWFGRQMVATLPYFSLLSGACFYVLHEMTVKIFSSIPIRARTATISSIVVAILAVSVKSQTISAMDRIRLYNLPDSRWISLQYVEKSLPPGSAIGREVYTPPVEEYSDKFTVEYLGKLGAIRVTPDTLKKLDYMIVSSSSYGRFFRQKDKYPLEVQAYEDFFERHELIERFKPDRKTLGGPTIEIYKIQHEK